MKDNFDKNFRERIKEVFENREEPYNPEDWKKLKAKIDKDKDRVFFWSYGRSAVIIILIIMISSLSGVMLYNTFLKKNRSIDINDKLITVETEPGNKGDKNISDSTDQAIIKAPASNRYHKNRIKINQQNKDDISKSVITTHGIHKKDSGPILPLKVKRNFADMKEKWNNTQSQITPREYLQKKSMRAEDLSVREIAAEYGEKMPLDSLLKRDIDLILENPNEINFKKRPVTFGLIVSPAINYEQSTRSKNFGLGGGFIMDVPISRNIDVSTGLLITNQRILFQKNMLEIVSSGTQLKLKEAALVGLDIPINLKYNFLMLNTKMYISAGLSSVTYLKEDIESTFQVTRSILYESIDNFGNPILVSNTENSIRKVTESRGAFNSVHFGKILNLSFGIELPFNTIRPTILFEPYFKYSLELLTSDNFDFSSGGVSLKLMLNDN